MSGLVRVAPPHQGKQLLIRLVTALTALLLVLALWPHSFMAAGLVLMTFALVFRHQRRVVRLSMFIVGTLFALPSAVMYLDFAWGTLSLNQGA